MTIKTERSARRPTLKDVAKLAGVDPSLVSKVLNEDPNLSITPATRERVMSAVAELDFRINVRARGLRLSKTWMIGAVFPDLRNPVYVPIFEGARMEAAKHGYGLILGTADGPPGMSQEPFERLLLDQHVDGLLIASGQVSDDKFMRMASRVGPVLAVNRFVEGHDSSLLVDDEAGCALAAEHLCSLGHRKLAVISGPTETRGDTQVSQRRSDAFTRRAQELGAEVTTVYARDWTSSAGLKSTSELLSRTPGLTAIFTTTVLLALGALRGCRKFQLAIPADISIISLNDTEVAALTEPPLTTIALPLEELGRLAVERLLAKIEGQSVGHEMVPTGPELIMRESTEVVRGRTLSR